MKRPDLAPAKLAPSARSRPALALVIALLAPAACSRPSDRKGQGEAPTPAPSASVVVEKGEGGDAAAGSGAKAKASAPKAKPDRALSPPERRAYLAALADARAAHKKGDRAAALAGFDRALGLQPDDGRALSEKGWVEFLGGDLDAAERDTRKALERSVDAGLLGSTQYNLGRIQEARGDKPAAVASYLASIKVRPNEVVKKRLASLDPSAAARSALAARALEGPFASLAAFCEVLKKAPMLPDAKVFCDPSGRALGDLSGPAKPKGAGPKARVFGSNSGHLGEGTLDWGEVDYHLGVETPEGWYVLKDALHLYNPGAFGIHETAEIASFEWRDVVPGGASELVLRASHDRGDSDMGINEIETSNRELLIVCGFGASGRPSCVEVSVAESSKRELMNEGEEPAPGETPIEHRLFSHSYAFSVDFTPAGELNIRPKDLSGASPELKAMVGKHPLAFP